MRRQHWIGLGSLLGLMALFLSGTTAQSPKKRGEENLAQKIARLAKLDEKDAEQFLAALGPAVREELSRGKTVSLPGLGGFRIVRVAEHKDLRNGRPTMIPATNTVEFLADGLMGEAANSENAVPAETVPEFRYILIPGAIPSSKMPRSRTNPTRAP